MPVTQAEIARHLGLNQKTVSVAFGAEGRINDATRQRVLQAARQLGYRPNRLAAGLRGGATGSVGVIWGFVDPWAGDAIIGLEVLQRCQAAGRVTYQFQRSDDVDVLCQQLDEMVDRRVDAVIVQAIPGQLRHAAVQERLRAVPVVVAVTREPIDDFPGDQIVHDRDQAIREVVDHLVDAGRRRLGFVAAMGEESNPPKFRVFRDRCRERGLPDHPHMQIDLDRPAGPAEHGRRYREGFCRAFPGEVGVDALFCFNDAGAMFIADELAHRGLRVPEDVAVVGFNNIELGTLMKPRLATGDRKPGEVAQRVDAMLRRRFDDPEAPPQRATVHMQFLWRESAG